MCYKTLLVHLDDSPRCEARQAYALDLAERFDAHLIGLYLPMPHARAPAARNGSVPEHRREHTHAQFLEAGARAGRMVEWRALQPGDTPSATLHARHADLLVLGQGEHGNATFDPTSGLVVDLLMTAARPAVVIPHAGSFPTLARNILIAWDGSRAAARAASDALPLLQRADCVSIEMIAARPGTARVRAATEAEDAAAWLDLHDVGASFHECAREPGVKTAATLLDRASALHADMIVAGAYAHLRNFERVLGGVTHNLLETMTIPLLMSH